MVNGLSSLKTALMGLVRAEQPQVIYDDGGVERVIYTLPTTACLTRESVLVFSMPKAGSVMLENITRALSEQIGLCYVSIMGHFFSLGLPPTQAPESTSVIFRRKGYCYGGFRQMPHNFRIPILRKAKKILLVRDPRDMLVSHYFSLRESHPQRGNVLKTSVPKLEQHDFAKVAEINDYVKAVAGSYKKILTGYRHLIAQYQVRLYRYEDTVFDKEAWIDDICDYFGWDDVPAAERKRIAAEQDQWPEEESAARHVRQVRPGDHARKLTSQTIAELSEFFADEMRAFGYNEDAIWRSAAALQP